MQEIKHTLCNTTTGTKTSLPYRFGTMQQKNPEIVLLTGLEIELRLASENNTWAQETKTPEIHRMASVNEDIH